MKPLVLLMAAAAAALTLAAPGYAGKKHSRHTWKKMTLSEKLHVVDHEIARNRSTVHWWLHQGRRLASISGTPTHMCRAIGIKAPGTVCLAGQRLVHGLHVRSNLVDAIAAAKARAALGAFPPHHQLWLCIGGHEGSPTSVNPNGHYGMLQMTWNWMGLINGAASNYPQAVQEWAAEKAYAENGYSRSFLEGQWLEWDGAYECLAYA